MLTHIYSEPELVREKVSSSVKVYFSVGIAGAIGLSLIIAFLLSQCIARSYQLIFDDLVAHKEKVVFLEEMSSWQQLAKMLAHEIKNPLTPIEVLMSSLTKAYKSSSSKDFVLQLEDTEKTIYEELDQLKKVVENFSEFSDVPRVQTKETHIDEILERQVSSIYSAFPGADLKIQLNDKSHHSRVMLDVTMFKRILINIIRNGIEANPGQAIIFNIDLTDESKEVILVISNNGKVIPQEMTKKIFDPYISSKNNKVNMGLGLAIVKKIVVEHDAEIHYRESDGQPAFVIMFNKVV